MRTIALIAAACIGITSNSSGQSYRIKKYDIAIVPDFAAHEVSLSVSIDIFNPAVQDSFEFGLADGYRDVTVSADSSSAAFERGDGGIVVRLARPARSVTLHFSLKGLGGRSTDEDRSVINDSSLFLLWSDRFYPIDFDRWANVRTTILLPPGFHAIAPGRLVQEVKRGGNVLHVFETSEPAVSFSVFADARWVKTARRVNGIEMQTLLYPGSRRFSDKIFRTSAEVLGFYSQAFCTYPFDMFTFFTIDSMYARRAFPGFVGYSPRYLEHEFTTTGFDAHETALLWWGYTLRGDGPGGWQWTEGFGDYAEIMYEMRFGKPLSGNLKRFRESYLKTPREKDIPCDQLRGNTPQEFVHGKYPWLMHLLRHRAGESTFVNAMHLLFRKYRYGTFTMDEFVSTMERGLGSSLSWWRDEWLLRKGVPDISMSWSAQKEGAVSSVKCTIEQKGEIYRMPLELGFESRGKMVIREVSLGESAQAFTFRLRSVPDRVVVDPHGWILMNANVTGGPQ